MKFLERCRAGVADIAPLHCRPHQLLRIEFRCICRETHHREPRTVLRDERTNYLCLVCRKSVPYDDETASPVSTLECLQNGKNAFFPHGLFCNPGKGSSMLGAWTPCDHSCCSDVLPPSCALYDRCLSLHSPRTHHIRTI